MHYICNFLNIIHAFNDSSLEEGDRGGHGPKTRQSAVEEEEYDDKDNDDDDTIRSVICQEFQN
jgi:hypothetical protein